MAGPALPVSSQQYLPWPETVVITSVGTGGSSATIGTAGVYQLGNAEGAPSQGAYTKFDIQITIGSDSLTWTPKPADTVLWNGNTYTVLDVKTSNWMLVHQLHARNLVLANQLVQSGTLTRPTAAKDSAGRPSLASYTTVAAAVPCRLQPVGGEATDIGQRRTIPQRFTVFLGQQVVAQATDVFTVAGQDYTVLDFKLPQRIDELMTLTCELVS